MEATDFVLVARSPSDLMSCVVYAAHFRRAGHVTHTFLNWCKYKKQIVKAWALEPAFILTLDGESVEIWDTTTRKKYKTTKDDAREALLELWDEDWFRTTNETAKLIEKDTEEWINQQSG